MTDIAQLNDDIENYPIYERPDMATVGNWMAVNESNASWLFVMPEATERFPKGWSIADGRARLDLHPLESEPPRWRRGMALFQRWQLVKF